MYRIGVDLGGTNIAVGVVDESMKIIGRGKVKTRCPRPAAEIFDDIAVAVNMAVKDAGISIDDVKSVGVGTPGSVNKENGYLTVDITVGNEPIMLGLSQINVSENPTAEQLRSNLLTRYQGSNLAKCILFGKNSTLPHKLKDAMKEFDHLV